MSKLSKLLRKAAPIVSTIAPALGPMGMGASVALSAISAIGAAKKTPSVLPGAGEVWSPGVSSFGAIAAPVIRAGASRFPSLLGFGAGAVVRGGVAGARRIYTAAAGYCRKHPQWCASIGGIAAVEAMISGGQLPVPKRRRGKGITATELRNFKRVVRFTSKYCAPVRRASKAPAMRRSKSCP